jgi:deazaflavin-dependent oxidoreductase (nitroreductase family)
MLRIAGGRHLPVVGIVHHRGRKTGRPYSTPLGIRPAAAGGFAMPLTFGEAAGWYRNIVAAGWCVVTWRGEHDGREGGDGARARLAGRDGGGG